MIKLQLFAGIAEKLGSKQVVLNVDEMTVIELKTVLSKQYPSIATDLQQAMIAINEEFVSGNTRIQQHDVVAIIPPVSGG